MRRNVILLLFITTNLLMLAEVDPIQPTFSDSVFAKIHTIFCTDYHFLRILHVKSNSFSIPQKNKELTLVDSADYCRQNFCVCNYRTGEYYRDGLSFSFSRTFGIYSIRPLSYSHGGQLLIFIENGNVEIHPLFSNLLYIIRKLIDYMEKNKEIVSEKEFRSIITHLSGLTPTIGARRFTPHCIEDHQFKIFLEK